MAGTTRARILDAAVRLTASSGWAAVTMARLADEVGVSRQTVYNEVGSKPALAETMILEELARFLAVVDQAFDTEPADLTRAIGRAVTDVLTYARANPLLHAVVSATHGADTELLPLLTTNAGSLLEAAKAVILARVALYAPGLDTARRSTFRTFETPNWCVAVPRAPVYSALLIGSYPISDRYTSLEGV